MSLFGPCENPLYPSRQIGQLTADWPDIICRVPKVSVGICCRLGAIGLSEKS